MAPCILVHVAWKARYLDTSASIICHLAMSVGLPVANVAGSKIIRGMLIGLPLANVTVAGRKSIRALSISLSVTNVAVAGGNGI